MKKNEKYLFLALFLHLTTSVMLKSETLTTSVAEPEVAILAVETTRPAGEVSPSIDPVPTDQSNLSHDPYSWGHLLDDIFDNCAGFKQVTVSLSLKRSREDTTSGYDPLFLDPFETSISCHLAQKTDGVWVLLPAAYRDSATLVYALQGGPGVEAKVGVPIFTYDGKNAAISSISEMKYDPKGEFKPAKDVGAFPVAGKIPLNLQGTYHLTAIAVQ